MPANPRAARTTLLVAVVFSAAFSAVQCRPVARDLPHDPYVPGAGAPEALTSDDGARDAAPEASEDTADGESTRAEENGRPVPLGWNDPATLAGLAKSCDFTPWDDEGGKREAWYSCQGDLPEQSCAFDPCYLKSQACKPGCAQSCESCDAVCVGTCGRCEAWCHDDACRTACAKTTADCRMACTSGRDRCVSAGCTQQYVTCAKAFDETWRKNKCARHCDEINACLERCDGAEACQHRCYTREVPGCPSLSGVCVMGDPSNPSGPPEP